MTRAVALLCILGCTVAAVLAIVTAREFALGREEVAAADESARTADWAEAIVHARAAAQALALGSPWPDLGFARMQSLGRDAEARGDQRTALLAYGAMRTAALSTRAFGSHAARWRLEAEESLGRVAARRDAPALLPASADAMRSALAAEDSPSLPRRALLGAGALVMLLGLACVAVLVLN
jgi:hypothetical protein